MATMGGGFWTRAKIIWSIVIVLLLAGLGIVGYLYSTGQLKFFAAVSEENLIKDGGFEFKGAAGRVKTENLGKWRVTGKGNVTLIQPGALYQGAEGGFALALGDVAFPNASVSVSQIVILQKNQNYRFHFLCFYRPELKKNPTKQLVKIFRYDGRAKEYVIWKYYLIPPQIASSEKKFIEISDSFVAPDYASYKIEIGKVGYNKDFILVDDFRLFRIIHPTPTFTPVADKRLPDRENSEIQLSVIGGELNSKKEQITPLCYEISLILRDKSNLPVQGAKVTFDIYPRPTIEVKDPGNPSFTPYTLPALYPQEDCSYEKLTVLPYSKFSDSAGMVKFGVGNLKSLAEKYPNAELSFAVSKSVRKTENIIGEAHASEILSEFVEKIKASDINSVEKWITREEQRVRADGKDGCVVKVAMPTQRQIDQLKAYPKDYQLFIDGKEQPDPLDHPDIKQKEPGIVFYEKHIVLDRSTIKEKKPRLDLITRGLCRFESVPKPTLPVIWME